jgi:mRNA-degrading endonuclease toxin of MazEF toxin-antitoxin module
MAERGDIVIVIDLLDPQGRNPKNRPCVLVSTPDRIVAGGPFEVVAITTLVPDPLPFDHVALPWQPQGQTRSKTGLDKPNAAVCSWLVEIEAARAVRKIGSIPARRMLQIDAVLRALRGDDTA